MGTIKNSWMQLSNPENKIHEEVVKVEISSEGLKALKDEEKIAFLQESLQTAGSLHRIEQGRLNWNPSFQFASLSSDLANRLHK